MATNNFLDFANTDTGTNLLTQAEYIAASDRTNGNQPGVASSKLVNKALRQSSFIIANIAQYISDKLNSNVLDDGNNATFLAQVNSAFTPSSSFGVQNLTISATVGASALTVAVKTQAATNPSATDICYVGIRSATLTSGIYNRRSITGSLSMVVSSGSTLGQSNGVAGLIYVYLLDNAGTLELAVSQSFYPENALITTTAEGGAGGADSGTLIYSTTARSNVPIRLIGTLTNTQATAGTWATNPSQIQLLPAQTNNTAISVKSLTTTYSAVSTDGLLLCSGSAFTVTLPTAVGIQGSSIRIKKTDASLTNIVTIATTSSQTVDGASGYSLNTLNEEIQVISDGANWYVLSHVIPSNWTAYTPTFTGFGTATTIEFQYRRVGDGVEVRGKFTCGTTTATEARITYPSGVTTSDTGKIPSIQAGGDYFRGGLSTALHGGAILVEPSTTYMTMSAASIFSNTSSDALAKQNGNTNMSSGDVVSVIMKVPVTGWNG